MGKYSYTRGKCYLNTDVIVIMRRNKIILFIVGTEQDRYPVEGFVDTEDLENFSYHCLNIICSCLSVPMITVGRALKKISNSLTSPALGKLWLPWTNMTRNYIETHEW